MKKTLTKILSIILSIMMTVLIIPMSNISVSAIASGVCGGDASWFLTSDGTLTISGVGETDNYAYSTPPWSSYKEQIKSVVIGEGITHLGTSAFEHYSTIESVSLPNSLQSTGSYCFQGCTSLKEIDFGDEPQLKRIGQCNFTRTNLSDIVIPDTVTEIGQYAFRNSNITSVVLSENLNNIGVSAFEGCSKLKVIYVANEKHRDWMANFAGAGNAIPKGRYITKDGIRYIYDGNNIEILGYDGKSSYFEVPEMIDEKNVTSIGVYSFNGNNNISSVVLPSSMIEIREGAFGGCTNLKQINLGENLETIYAEAFKSCVNLSNISLSSTIKTIGQFAFYDCESLTDVYYSDSKYTWNNIDINNYNEPLINATIHYNSVGKMASIVADCEVGDIIEFGSYPQNEVTDKTLLAELNSLELEWNSYGYYSGTGNLTDGKMTLGDYMKYADVIYNSNKYRAVKFTEYRPCYTGNTTASGDTFQDDNEYYINTVYWFKYEPLMWRVLDPNEGFILCETIIDSQPYNNTIYFNSSDSEYYQNSNCTNYANDYATSSIRFWLNNDFYNTAFNNVEKNEILQFEQNNNCSSSRYPQYNSNITNDKVFLISYNEATANEYGFSVSTDDDDSRITYGTDYAKAQGLNTFSSHCNSWWWLRSPGGNSRGATSVGTQGKSDYIYETYSTKGGVRPALKFNPKNENEECKHNYVLEVTSPTCTEQGFTTYTCSVCGDTYTSDFVDALGHTDGEIVEENYIAPTCSANGSKDNVTYCTVCNAETSRETITVPALGHTEKEILAVAPTCTDTGLTTGVKCSVCNEVLEPQQEVPALGHDIITDYAIAPDCTNTGLTAGEHCSRCDYKVEQTVVDAFGHKYDSVITAPTCTSQGYTTYTCHCGDTYTGDYVDVLAHNYKDGICTDCETPDPAYFTFEIQKPSRTTIRCNDGIKLHTKITGKLPDGSRIEWARNNNNFNMTTSASGNEITIISKNNGYTTFTATVYDADNNVIAQDTIEMYSKAGLFDKIGGFFRSLFGLTKIYEN